MTVPTQEFSAVARVRTGAGGTRQTDSQPELEDTYLVALAKAGSADAYERIVKRYRVFEKGLRGEE